MNEEIKSRIETAINNFTEEHFGGFEIFNNSHITEVSELAGVCPGIVYDYLNETIFGIS